MFHLNVVHLTVPWGYLGGRGGGREEKRVDALLGAQPLPRAISRSSPTQ